MNFIFKQKLIINSRKIKEWKKKKIAKLAFFVSLWCYEDEEQCSRKRIKVEKRIKSMTMKWVRWWWWRWWKKSLKKDSNYNFNSIYRYCFNTHYIHLPGLLLTSNEIFEKFELEWATIKLLYEYINLFLLISLSLMSTFFYLRRDYIARRNETQRGEMVFVCVVKTRQL